MIICLLQTKTSLELAVHLYIIIDNKLDNFDEKDRHEPDKIDQQLEEDRQELNKIDQSIEKVSCSIEKFD